MRMDLRALELDLERPGIDPDLKSKVDLWRYIY
ncbi:putative feruloyl esterase [Venturia inaequalis]|nr:putative feruloyl esterase [Venturia inaequalis]